MTNSELITVVILTRNEEIHIERCILSALRLTSRVVVVDSQSSDRTVELARAYGARVISGEFSTFSGKLNWTLDNVSTETPWIMRLDADEVISNTLISAIPEALHNAEVDVNGFFVRRQLWFMGRWVRYGGMYPTYSLRIWRTGTVRCEPLDLDEHMILLSGRSRSLEFDVIDNPLFDLSTWVEKHNRYATLEARGAFRTSLSEEVIVPSLFGSMPHRRRWLKLHVFNRLPLFVRPWLYFIYRFVVRGGFLDGRTGFVFHFLHGLWYRMLIDAKVLESVTASTTPDRKPGE